MRQYNKMVLVGMPGSGKSTLGKRVARLLNVPFFDLDHEIENRDGTKIPEIFAAHGEDYFRELETKTLVELLHRDESFVLSTGGGAPCFNGNMDLINQLAVSVYLDVPMSELLFRLIKGQAGKRPLFAQMNEEEVRLKLLDMYQQRSVFYRMARITLSGKDISAEQLAVEWLGFSKIEP
ncbi:Shikimate kinase I [Lunatimonas lonarensis]|uniref:Shikimate kinase n=1 Tax=Lunatimonas lonarensis TaxID=1232681 RepID=R7ZLP3_9BACT|nr:shikimate kinase [Lunatimonas lonarensis]EON74992.1 Shikimate kinase I [Lunatimonas lonarensis]